MPAHLSFKILFGVLRQIHRPSVFRNGGRRQKQMRKHEGEERTQGSVEEHIEKFHKVQSPPFLFSEKI